MKRVDGLFEQVCAFETLWKATERAAKGKRQRKDVQAFLWDREAEILRLQEELRSGGYEPGRLRHFWVCDPKARRISAAGFRDRVVHHALCGVLEPHLEAYATRDSYACRKGKGSLRALEAAQTYARRYPYVLKLDIERFFESIDHGVLQAALERKFGERALHRLFAKILGVPLEGSREGKGLPIGNLTSQHFANFYLGRLDHAAKESVRLGGYVRYMDDILCFGAEKAALWDALFALQEIVVGELCLDLKRSVTRLCPVTEGVRFLGVRVFPSGLRWTAARKHRFCRGFRRLWSEHRAGKVSEVRLAACSAARLGHSLGRHTLPFRRRFFEGIGGGVEA